MMDKIDFTKVTGELEKQGEDFYINGEKVTFFAIAPCINNYKFDAAFAIVAYTKFDYDQVFKEGKFNQAGKYAVKWYDTLTEAKSDWDNVIEKIKTGKHQVYWYDVC